MGKHQLRVVSVESNPPHLELQCVQPEGSPLQHQVFDVGTAGATLGRKASHVIAFSRDVDGTPVGVDSSVSNEHATITYDVGKGGFVLRDASSTNGTWVRLRETRVPLATNDELLVGSIRFLCTATETIVERDL